MSTDIQFGRRLWIVDLDGASGWSVDWDPWPHEEDGTSGEFSFAHGTPGRAHSNVHTRDWVKSSPQATRLAGLVSITPGWNDPQITCLDDEVMDAIDALPDGPDDFSADMGRWFKYWAHRSRAEFGMSAAIITF
jgi:hypothetical protein